MKQILAIVALIFPVWALAQQLNPQGPDTTETTRIEILHSDLLSFAKIDGIPIQKLIGNVRLKQDSTYFYCDSAYNYELENRLEAFSNVKVEMPDSITLRCDRLSYDGINRISYAYDNITLTDQAVVLETDRLNYYRDEKYGKYFDGGSLVDEENELTSILGYYYPQEDMAYFRDSVKLYNEDYTLYTDTLGYNTETKVAYFVAETQILSEEGELATDDGSYDTQNKKINLFHRSTVQDSSYRIQADTLFYNNFNNLGYGFDRVMIEQNDSSMQVWGDYAIFNRVTDEATITQNAVAIQYMEDDTMYLIADTLYSYTDSNEHRIFRAYNDVSIFMNDMQGIADSMVYFLDDSLILLYQDPIIWSDSSQLTGDTIQIFLRDSKADSMWAGSNGFLVSQEDTIGFNQIKGREMRAKFRENKLYRLHVVGNSESLYFAENEEGGYEGMNEALSQEMYIFFKENKVNRINFIAKPTGTFHPLHEILFKTNQLEGMRWRITERPFRPELDPTGGLLAKSASGRPTMPMIERIQKQLPVPAAPVDSERDLKQNLEDKSSAKPNPNLLEELKKLGEDPDIDPTLPTLEKPKSIEAPEQSEEPEEP